MATLTNEQIEAKKQQLKQLAEEAKKLKDELVEAGAWPLEEDELGDVAWYLALTSHALGLTLEEVLEHNIEKLKKRYPEGFSAEKSLHRAE